jgi:hypothetical protein
LKWYLPYSFSVKLLYAVLPFSFMYMTNIVYTFYHSLLMETDKASETNLKFRIKGLLAQKNFINIFYKEYRPCSPLEIHGRFDGTSVSSCETSVKSHPSILVIEE